MANPYESPSTKNRVHDDQRPVIAWYLRPYVIAGVGLMAIAALCVVATVFSMQVAFTTIGKSGSAVDPEELANAISHALLYSIPAVPLGLGGLVMVIVGLASKPRRPAEQDSSDA
ncbi:hypothetical protein [Aeoliella mucimassa]|uniref:MotA/TolQ/ExbB proton channel domain-containing protein n=1 Tax=Aeoliella mucimassa TaxID=2527972 RepID=A0A518AGN0_9BACT|nr:hypothetical protein [Aeoliella mucimassa]QDU53864.1 hypothetical protein Pan181_00420 [Aeoliella mucimassa]